MNLLKYFFTTVLLINIINWPAYGQKINESYRLNITKTYSPITVDGILDEPAWLKAEIATDFFMVTPMDTSYADLRTEVRMTYDDENLYIIAINYRPKNRSNVVESLRRDFSFGRNDNFLVFIDPFDDQTNGFTFGVNAEGAQWDGLMFDGSSVNLSWDNKWISEVKNYEDKWIFEASIPFKSLRYDEEITEWGINFSRNDLTNPEKSSWAPVPRQFPSAALAYTGTLVWKSPPPSTGANISIIPHVLGGFQEDLQSVESASYRKEAGLNAKIGISSSLNLDLTVNPDFSQVEVDEQIIDLDRFELFFPERRQFFLENEDLFANFGNRNIRPFFSRRVGLDAPILFGGRLSGQVNQNWRLGLMNMQTERVNEADLPAQNFSVLALKRRISARSNIGLIFVNLESMNHDSRPVEDEALPASFDRNIGVEYNLATANDLWNGNFMLLKSFMPEANGRSFSHSSSLLYSDGNWKAEWAHEYVGNEYSAEAGYVPRKGYIRFNPQIDYLFFPDNSTVLSHGPSLDSSVYFDETFQITDYENRLIYNINFYRGSRISGWVSDTFVKLLDPFDPTNVTDTMLEVGTSHNWISYGAEIESRAQTRFTYSLSMHYGGFYADGTRLNMTSEIGYRFQPYVNISLSTSYNRLLLPEPWRRFEFWLTGTRVDITLTNNLYLTSFTQYNEQLDNININTRFQWRFQPASDLFIVYTDNYLPGSFAVKNRALLFKFTYWWNI